MTLHNYVFHFNEYKKIWSAIPRELYNQYWSDASIKGVISSAKFEVVLELVNKVSKDSKYLDSILEDDV